MICINSLTFAVQGTEMTRVVSSPSMRQLSSYGLLVVIVGRCWNSVMIRQSSGPCHSTVARVGRECCTCTVTWSQLVVFRFGSPSLLYMLLSMPRQCASPHSTLYHHHLPSACRLPAADFFPLLSHMSSISDISQSSSSTTFQALFNTALQNYNDKTGASLIDHPFAIQLETCESVSSITSVLQEQARNFHEFRENDGKLMKALNSSVDVLCAPSISSALNVVIGLVVCQKPFISVPCS
jgi:hypothetical protein